MRPAIPIQSRYRRALADLRAKLETTHVER
jgi:hypothetical protein